MELLNYDKERRVSTITLTDDELVDIHSVLGGVRSTFHMQDATILGMDREQLDALKEKVHKIIITLNNKDGIKKRKWEDM